MAACPRNQTSQLSATIPILYQLVFAESLTLTNLETQTPDLQSGIQIWQIDQKLYL